MRWCSKTMPSRKVDKIKKCTLMLLAACAFMIFFPIGYAEETKEELYDGYCVKEQDGMYVVVNQQGEELHAPIPHQIYDDNIEIQEYDGTRYLIHRFFYEDLSRMTYVAIAITPGEVFTGFIYGEVFPFTEGLAPACYAELNVEMEENEYIKWDDYLDYHGYGYIGLDGKMKIPFQWIWCDDFEGGRAAVTYATTQSYESLIINKEGTVIEIVPIQKD